MAKAIAMLREKMGLTQGQFARELGVSAFTVSRYESGRSPSRAIMSKLAAIADKNKLDDVREFFQRARRKDIKESYENRPSAGTGRHIPLSDLTAWSNRVFSISESIRDAMSSTDQALKRAAMMNALVTADFLREDIRTYIGGEDPMHSTSGLREYRAWRKENRYLLRAFMEDWKNREFGDEVKGEHDDK